MTRRLSVALIPLVAFLSPAVSPGHAQPRGEETTPRQTARTAAQEWLRHVDAGAWKTAWKEAASVLRDTVTEKQWVKQGTRMRETIGELRSRRLARMQSRDTLRSPARAGPFFLLRYHSTFEDGLYVETLLLAPEEDTWTVAGYEVAPMAAPPHRRRDSSRKEKPN